MCECFSSNLGTCAWWHQCHMQSADGRLLLSNFFSDSYSHYFWALVRPSVRGLHQGTLTACFKPQCTNHSSCMHPLLGSSHFVPIQSLHARAWPLRKKNDTFDLIKVAIWHDSHDTPCDQKFAIGAVKKGAMTCFQNLLQNLKEAIKNLFFFLVFSFGK